MLNANADSLAARARGRMNWVDSSRTGGDRVLRRTIALTANESRKKRKRGEREEEEKKRKRGEEERGEEERRRERKREGRE